MIRSSLAYRRTVALVLLLAASIGTAATPASAAPAQTPPPSYVALGDSFTAWVRWVEPLLPLARRRSGSAQLRMSS